MAKRRRNPGLGLDGLLIGGAVALVGYGIYRQTQAIAAIGQGAGGALAATGQGVGGAFGNTGQAIGGTFSTIGSDLRGLFGGQ